MLDDICLDLNRKERRKNVLVKQKTFMAKTFETTKQKKTIAMKFWFSDHKKKKRKKFQLWPDKINC